MKRYLAGALLLALVLCMPMQGLSEDKHIVRLAQTIYAVARNDSYEAKLALGSVVMNRVASPWYPETLEGVLSQKHQFPAGQKYDEESLRAAHEIVSGRRTVSSDMLEWSTDPVAGATRIGGIYVSKRH